jgi:hypothetical protein
VQGSSATCAGFPGILASGASTLLGWHVTLLLDSNRSHTAIASQALAAKFGIQLLRLPKRAPELNPMDTLWGQGKDAICANKQTIRLNR